MTAFQKILRSNAGTAAPFLLAAVFSTMCMLAVLWQGSILYLQCYRVKDAMQKTVLTAVARNSEETYFSKREAYTGAWKKASDWLDVAEAVNPTEQLAEILGLAADGSDLVKQDSSGKVLYRLTDIQLAVQNPVYLEERESFSVKLALAIQLPVRYAVTATQTFTLPLTAVAENNPKY